jgi:hypothetical protein
VERTEWWTSPRTGKKYVKAYKVSLPALKETFDVTTPVNDQEMARDGRGDLVSHYWEGTLDVVRHNADGSTTQGVGYCEQFPYSKLIDWSKPTQSKASPKVETFH